MCILCVYDVSINYTWTTHICTYNTIELSGNFFPILAAKERGLLQGDNVACLCVPGAVDGAISAFFSLGQASKWMGQDGSGKITI